GAAGGRRVPAHQRGGPFPDRDPGLVAGGDRRASGRGRDGARRSVARTSGDPATGLPPAARAAPVMKIGSRSFDRYFLVGLFNTGLDLALFTLLAVGVGLAAV